MNRKYILFILLILLVLGGIFFYIKNNSVGYGPCVVGIDSPCNN